MSDLLNSEYSQLLTDDERQLLMGIAKRTLGFSTLNEAGVDRLDFRDVSVWSVRDALTLAFLAGAARR